MSKWVEARKAKKKSRNWLIFKYSPGKLCRRTARNLNEREKFNFLYFHVQIFGEQEKREEIK